MIGMDCVNQQAVSDRDCSHCIWHTDGRCASWDCEYISRKEALEALEKVKAMSTHPNTPNTLKALDCISRKDAIDLIEDIETKRLKGEIGLMYAPAIKGLKALPSAQPEIEERMSETEQNVPNDDFISRKRAIDALMEDFKRIPTNAIRAKTVIEQLPPAQPEIIRCEDCANCQIDDVYHDYWCDGKKVWKDHFCGYAERRTDEHTVSE